MAQQLRNQGINALALRRAGSWSGSEHPTPGATLAEERESTADGLFSHSETDSHRISVEDLQRLLGNPNPPLVLDVRSRSSYQRDGGQIPGSVRVLPDQAVEWAGSQDLGDRLVAAYCT